MSRDLLSVEQAADRLGLSRVRVQKLIESGQLPASRSAGAWWIDSRAVDRRGREQPGSGRPLSCAAAWLVLLLASDEPETPAWQPLLVHSHIRERARSWLRSRSVGANAPALRDRAKRESLDVHPSELPSILADENVRPTGASAASRIGLTGGPDEAEFYASASLRPVLLHEHAMRPAPDGAVLARWVPDEIWPVLASLESTPSAAVLVDLLEHDDPRARREAASALIRSA